jgi:hypothetical protein
VNAGSIRFERVTVDRRDEGAVALWKDRPGEYPSSISLGSTRME